MTSKLNVHKNFHSFCFLFWCWFRGEKHVVFGELRFFPFLSRRLQMTSKLNVHKKFHSFCFLFLVLVPDPPAFQNRFQNHPAPSKNTGNSDFSGKSHSEVLLLIKVLS